MKTAQLQIRVTPAQKALLKQRAARAGLGVSAYVLSRVAPDAALRVEGVLAEVARSHGDPYALAALHDLLVELAPAEFAEAFDAELPPGLSLRTQNLVAAMIEHAAARVSATPPAWLAAVPPLDEPWFASDLPGLRAHLLRTSPAAFRRRNLFVDASIGARV